MRICCAYQSAALPLSWANKVAILRSISCCTLAYPSYLSRKRSTGPDPSNVGSCKHGGHHSSSLAGGGGARGCEGATSGGGTGATTSVGSGGATISVGSTQPPQKRVQAIRLQQAGAVVAGVLHIDDLVI